MEAVVLASEGDTTGSIRIASLSPLQRAPGTCGALPPAIAPKPPLSARFRKSATVAGVLPPVSKPVIPPTHLPLEDGGLSFIYWTAPLPISIGPLTAVLTTSAAWEALVAAVLAATFGICRGSICLICCQEGLPAASDSTAGRLDPTIVNRPAA